MKLLQARGWRPPPPPPPVEAGHQHLPELKPKNRWHHAANKGGFADAGVVGQPLVSGGCRQ